jgi:uncharacterized OB-fold protein
MVEKPLPNINSDNREFWLACRNHQLKFQRCEECGHIRWPASIICPVCHSTKADWIVCSGKGKVYTFIIYHVAFHPAFADDIPYVVAIVELDEGPHLLSNIVGCTPEEVACEMPVEVVWKDVNEDVSLPVFKRVDPPTL